MLESEKEDTKTRAAAASARVREQQNAVRCQVCRKDKIPHRYNYCACGMQECKECITNPYHGGKRSWGCPYCETHHKAQCQCGTYNDQPKNCVRAMFDWETGIAEKGLATETMEQERARKESEKAEKRRERNRERKAREAKEEAEEQEEIDAQTKQVRCTIRQDADHCAHVCPLKNGEEGKGKAATTGNTPGDGTYVLEGKRRKMQLQPATWEGRSSSPGIRETLCGDTYILEGMEGKT